MKQFNYKIILAGESGVGKTTLVYRYINNRFKDDLKKTIGVDFSIKNIEINRNKIKLQIWDLGGEQKFRSFLRGYIKKSDGVLFLFDLNNFETLNQIGEWMGIMREENNYTPILLVGAKSDIYFPNEKSVKFIGIIQTHYDFFDYIETSSKLGNNVNNAFELLIKRIYDNIEIVLD